MSNKLVSVSACKRVPTHVDAILGYSLSALYVLCLAEALQPTKRARIRLSEHYNVNSGVGLVRGFVC